MYHALLVDDEISILNNLYDAVPWEEYGFEEITFAHDGIEALANLQQKNFDLMITDIKMPDMDGIELLRNVRNLYPDISCILLTAYSEFEYVRGALQLGVDNYLLKPLNVAELTASIEKSLLKHNKTQFSAANNICNDLFYRNLLHRWVTGGLTGHELSERARLTDLNIFCRNYCVILVHLLNEASVYSNFLTAIQRSLHVGYEVYYLSTHPGINVFIVGGHKVDCHTIQDRLWQVADMLPANSGVLTVIGPTVGNSDDLYTSYNSAESILKSFMLISPNVQNTILLADNIHNPPLKNVQYILNDILYDSSYESAQKKAMEFAYETFNKYSSAYKTSHTYLNEILYSIAYEVGKSFSHIMDIPIPLQQRFVELSKISSQNEFTECMRSLVIEVRKVIRRETENFSPIVNRALQYVNNNYSEQISTKQFSETCGANASYFGYLFKKEIGLYFFEYINQVRIKHAENLLLTTNQTITAISAKTGFTDDSYFYKCFKKENGISPAKYRIMYKN